MAIYSSLFSIRIGTVCFKRKPSPTILGHSFWITPISKLSFGVGLVRRLATALLKEVLTSRIFDTNFKDIPRVPREMRIGPLWTTFVGFSSDSFFSLWKGIVEWLLFLYCLGQ